MSEMETISVMVHQDSSKHNTRFLSLAKSMLPPFCKSVVPVFQMRVREDNLKCNAV
jgi:hypothetical protein